ncbi:hypothetical protein [Algirhabdus cladophorae]|uniref:hypothetical protein n=1 Tax=Algirhabdus cladophorae TaxID=3377108 RepID=UPI003B84817D
MADLAARLAAAHVDGDAATLSGLYAEAAEGCGTEDEACFLLTHAYVFALQAGLRAATDLQYRLWQLGREEKPEGIEA